MRSHHKLNPADLLEGLTLIDSDRIIHTLETGIKVDTLTLEANKIVENTHECKEIRNRISDARVLLSFIHLRKFEGLR